MSLKQALLGAGLGLVESDFDTHESDLYVLNKPGVWQWLQRNYNRCSQVTTFVGLGDWDNKVAMEIPFGYMDEFLQEKQANSADKHYSNKYCY